MHVSIARYQELISGGRWVTRCLSSCHHRYRESFSKVYTCLRLQKGKTPGAHFFTRLRSNMSWPSAHHFVEGQTEKAPLPLTIWFAQRTVWAGKNTIDFDLMSRLLGSVRSSWLTPTYYGNCPLFLQVPPMPHLQNEHQTTKIKLPDTKASPRHFHHNTVWDFKSLPPLCSVFRVIYRVHE